MSYGRLERYFQFDISRKNEDEFLKYISEGKEENVLQGITNAYITEQAASSGLGGEVFCADEVLGIEEKATAIYEYVWILLWPSFNPRKKFSILFRLLHHLSCCEQ